MEREFSWKWMWALQNSTQRPTQWLESTSLGTDCLQYQGWSWILNSGSQRLDSRNHMHSPGIHKVQFSPKKTLEERTKVYSSLTLCLHGKSPIHLRSQLSSRKQAPKDLVLNQPRISRTRTYRRSLAFPANIFLLIQLFIWLNSLKPISAGFFLNFCGLTSFLQICTCTYAGLIYCELAWVTESEAYNMNLCCIMISVNTPSCGFFL